MSDFNNFKNIITPTEWKEKLYVKIEELSETTVRRRRLPLTATAVLILVIILSTSVLAVSIVGGYFIQLFTNKAESSGGVYDYMNVEQLSAISGTTIGTVIETNEIKIEVMDVISSGNMAMVMLRITAKELQSVLFDTGYETLMNYRFAEIDGSLLKNMEQTNVRYYYSDDDPTLADNQFEILYTIINHNDFEAGTYSIILENFGYYVSNGTSLLMKPLYKGKWKFELELTDGSKYSRTFLIRKPVAINEYNFMLENIKITPMSSTIVFSYNLHNKDVFEVFSSEVGSISVTLSNGTILTEEDFSYVIMSGKDGEGKSVSAFVINISYDLPISAEFVKEFYIFGETFSISNGALAFFP